MIASYPAPDQNVKWLMSTKKGEKSISGIMITAVENSYGKTTNSEGGSEKLILAISIPIILLLIIACVPLTIFLKRRGGKAEEPKVDANMYYGNEEEDYDDHDNAIVDTNEYYDT